MPLPTLTPQMTTLQAIASTSTADVKTAIAACINSLTGTDSNWTAANATGDAAGTPGLVISPPATSPIASLRALICADTAASGALYDSIDSYVSGRWLVQFGPDGITGSNNWYHATLPFGTGKRARGFSQWLPVTTGTKVWCLATAETLWLFVRGTTDSAIYACMVGSPVHPRNSASSESGRLYGHFSGGATAWSSTTHTVASADDFLRHSTAAGQSHGWVWNPQTSLWQAAGWRGYNNTMGASDSNSAQTADGKTDLQDVMIHWYDGAGNPGARCGKMRDFYEAGVKLARGTIQDSSMVTKGYAMSGDLANPVNAFALATA